MLSQGSLRKQEACNENPFPMDEVGFTGCAFTFAGTCMIAYAVLKFTGIGPFFVGAAGYQ